MLFSVFGDETFYGNAKIDVVSLKTGERKTVHDGGYFGRYLPSGHLVYLHQNTLFAAPFDLSRLEVTGSPQPVFFRPTGDDEIIRISDEIHRGT